VIRVRPGNPVKPVPLAATPQASNGPAINGQSGGNGKP